VKRTKLPLKEWEICDIGNTSIIKGEEHAKRTIPNVATKEEHNNDNGVNLMGEGLRDAFDPKLTRGKK